MGSPRQREGGGAYWSEREEGKGAALGRGWPARLGRYGPCAGGQGAGLWPTAKRRGGDGFGWGFPFSFFNLLSIAF